jgi:hypothetical protein
MTSQQKIAESLLRPINPTVIIILGIYTLAWGLWIFSPFWTVFTQAPLYSAMASIAGEYFWGAIAMASGAVIIRGALKPSYKNIQLGSFIAFFHWFVISILYFIGDWTSTGGLSSLTFAFYSALVWVNIKINRKHYDKMNEYFALEEM